MSYLDTTRPLKVPGDDQTDIQCDDCTVLVEDEGNEYYGHILCDGCFEKKGELTTVAGL